MDRLDAMRVFIAVVDAQGFSAASRTLCKPLPTVCRKVSELESELGVQLLARSTRKVTVTETGSRYYEDVRKILEDVDTADQRASGEYQRATGLLSITAPSMFGQFHVLPIVNDFMRLHPEIEVRLLSTRNQLLDLPEDHIDLAIRIGKISVSSMNLMEAGTVRNVVCASPSYIRENGRPLIPSEAKGHQCITFSRTGSQYPWAFKTASGKSQEVLVNSRLLLNSAEGVVDSAHQGCGLAQLYSYQVARHVASGDLELVLRDFEIDPAPVNLVYPKTRRVPQKVQAFLDFAMPALRESLASVARICA